jgi:hypothetical protein
MMTETATTYISYFISHSNMEILCTTTPILTPLPPTRYAMPNAQYPPPKKTPFSLKNISVLVIAMLARIH